MNRLRDTLIRWSPYMLSIFRIVIAVVFIEHGTQKLLGVPPLPPGMPHITLLSLAWVSGILELIGGFLLIIGLFVRPAAFILSGEMAVAYFMVHAPNNFYPVVNKGEIAVVYCFAFFYLAVAGGGPWSIGYHASQEKNPVKSLE